MRARWAAAGGLLAAALVAALASPAMASGDRYVPVTAEVGSVPSAGAEAVLTVPSGEVWYVVSAYVSLVTASTAGNRSRALDVLTPSAAIAAEEVGNGQAQTASTTLVTTWTAGVGGMAVAGTGTVTAPLPSDLILGAGWQLKTRTVNLAGGDQYSALTALVILGADAGPADVHVTGTPAVSVSGTPPVSVVGTPIVQLTPTPVAVTCTSGCTGGAADLGDLPGDVAGMRAGLAAGLFFLVVFGTAGFTMRLWSRH